MSLNVLSWPLRLTNVPRAPENIASAADDRNRLVRSKTARTLELQSSAGKGGHATHDGGGRTRHCEDRIVAADCHSGALAELRDDVEQA